LSICATEPSANTGESDVTNNTDSINIALREDIMTIAKVVPLLNAFLDCFQLFLLRRKSKVVV